MPSAETSPTAATTVEGLFLFSLVLFHEQPGSVAGEAVTLQVEDLPNSDDCFTEFPGKIAGIEEIDAIFSSLFDLISDSLLCLFLRSAWFKGFGWSKE